METLRNNRGIAIIYVTLFLLVLGLLFVALGIDVGWMAYVRTQGQAAVDAAALRGAAAIPNYNVAGDTTMVYDMAGTGFTDNKVMSKDPEITGSNIEMCADNPSNPNCQTTTYPTPAGGVKVTKTYSAPLFFAARLLNGGSSNVNLTVNSIAWLGGPGGLKPDLPIGMCQAQVGYPDTCSDKNPSEEKITWDGVGNQTASPTDDSAWWTPIDVQASASDCKKLVEDPSKFPLLHIDDPILRNNGQVTSCLNDIANTYASCPSTCDYKNPPPECTALVPVFDCTANPNQSAPVVGFAKICITGVKAQGEPKYIKGPLICNVPIPGAIGGGPFFGVYASRPVLTK